MTVGVRLKRLSLAAILVLAAVFVTIAPVGDAFAKRASITKSEALELCKTWHSGKGFVKKKHWVKYKKGYKCVGITWDISGSSGYTVQCGYKSGTPSTKENGKFDCMWPDGFKKETKAAGSEGSTANTEEDKKDKVTSVKDVVGGIDGNEKCVGSAIIWNKKEGDKKYFCEDSKGAGVYEILLIVLNILTGLVGVLGVLGIVISGITYLTSRDNVEQATKAKKRIVQIIIGLAIYAALYVGLQWLIPGGIFGEIG